MKITEGIVKTLMNIIKDGLCNGAGDMDKPGAFCVQQAVSKAVSEEEWSDAPACVAPEIRAFGICLNDRMWPSDKARAKGLKRFAIAELGSDVLCEKTFIKKLVAKWNTAKSHTHVDDVDQLVTIAGVQALPEVAEMAVQVLIEMESPGSKYLYLADEPKEVKQTLAKIVAPPPQLAWRGYATGKKTCAQSHCAK